MRPTPGIPIVLLAWLVTPVLGQTPHDHGTAVAPAPAVSQSAFAALKALDGVWVGQVTTTPKVAPVDGTEAQIAMRVTSRGHALVHEITLPGIPDHPVTLFYIEADRLTLTHYCDAGNRPRMVATPSPDGKTLAFEFLDLSGSNDHGHMHRGVFTFLDENHHIQEWTFMAPGDVPVRARFDLRRSGATAPPPR